MLAYRRTSYEGLASRSCIQPASLFARLSQCKQFIDLFFAASVSSPEVSFGTRDEDE